MYFRLLQSLKRRLVGELKDSFASHPVYEKIVPFIQNRNAFTERPQYGIVVKGSSANKVALSPDNFMGVIQSHVMLAYVGKPVFPLEWVREDIQCVASNGGRMPTPPGVYYIEILKAPTNAQEKGQYMIDPLISVNDERVLRFVTGLETEGQLQKVPLEGTVRLWENGKFLLTEGTHYTIDYGTGAIEFLGAQPPGAVVSADYRYVIESVGPIDFQWNTADFETLPGIVMAFGKRPREGDKVAVVVHEDRVDTAKAFGGRLDVNFDMDVIARDTEQSEEIADLVMMYLWSEKRDPLSFEGIEIVDVSIGGEAEEVHDDTDDTFYYTASLSVQIQSDWEVHVPLALTISKATATTAQGDKASYLDRNNPSTIINTVPNKLFFATLPVVAGRNNNYERIK